jgi:hypothetical protein
MAPGRPNPPSKIDEWRYRLAPVDEQQPAVSIGVPVYNGERFLRAALDTLLRQTFQDSTPPDP